MSVPYFAVWLGKRDGYARLYATTLAEDDAMQIVATCEQFGYSAYYTVETGPLVPLGEPDARRQP